MNIKIDNFNLTMASQHSYQETRTKNESLRLWINQPGPGNQGQNQSAQGQDTFTLSDQARALMEQHKASSCYQTDDDLLVDISSEDRQKLFMIEKMLELLTGKKFKFVLPKKPNFSAPNHQLTNQPGTSGSTAPNWGLSYQRRESYLEHERLSFNAMGIVRTQDGREIDFSVQLSMSRTFAQHTNINIQAGNAAVADPLVINFNGSAAQLTNTTFSFDLDLDGTPDQIHFVGANSGFLALDLNGDGLINDGSELFGPATGNGFAELAQYDSDNNGWIDENDPIFSRLRIWTKDAQGQDQLFALGEKGIGAIFVGHLNTPFALKDADNQLQGQVRSTGVYLNEDGTPGTIQQVDLVV